LTTLESGVYIGKFGVKNILDILFQGEFY